MKLRSKKKFVVVSAVVILGLVAVIFLNLPKPVASSDAVFDLGKIEDGSYLGDCDNGLVKVQVEVTVQNHAITDVRILKHDNGMGSAAEAITEQVVQRQSVEVDAVSGATLSSQTILKAVEVALFERQGSK